MRAFSGSTMVEQPTASNRRQPVRQTRTNPARTASNLVSAQGGASAQTPDNEQNVNPGFFPALTHYTDAITALPKEMIRHNTMLKEVDAKIFGPEAQLAELVNFALKTPIPPRKKTSTVQARDSSISNPTSSSNALPLPMDGQSRSETPSQANIQDPSDPAYSRRLQFQNIRSTLFGMLATLDEKNHVINTAIDCLEKQQKRCNSSFPHIEDEISEEARLGSLTHWAYTDKAAEKKGIIAGERTRRAANNAAAIHEAEVAALRSESRREALASKKSRNQHLDSDFDDGRTVGKKAQASGKGRKAVDAGNGNGIGLGIVNGAAPPTKRRKIEKAPAGNLGLERAMASVYGPSPGSGGRAGGNPRDASLNDTIGKKRGRGGVAANGNARRRSVSIMSYSPDQPLTLVHRAGTNASAVNSPSLASSPVVGTFAAAKDRQGRSPAPAMMQRMPSSRARQNSSQNMLQTSRNRSSSTNHKPSNSHGLYGTTADVEKVSGVTGRTAGDVKSTMKETVNAKGEHLIEDIGTGDGAGELRGGLVVGSRNQDRSLKREESVNGNGRTRPPSISVSTRGGNSKQASKTGTPINASFSEPVRSRAPREIPLKRSHKKGAGLAAQLAAAAATNGDDGSSLQEDEDDEEGDEPRYCYCNGVSYGEMVGCDGKECQKEWFHLECVGLEKAPGRNGKLVLALRGVSDANGISASSEMVLRRVQRKSERQEIQWKCEVINGRLIRGRYW